MKLLLPFLVALVIPRTAFAYLGIMPKVASTRSVTQLAMTDGDADDDVKVCLITGASRGIGKCIAMELAKAGNTKIVINHIAPEKENADQVVEELRAMGTEAIAVEADCECFTDNSVAFTVSVFIPSRTYTFVLLPGSKPDEIKTMFKEIDEKFGKCDVLVNNAGIARDGLTLRMKPEQWQMVIDINLSGVYYVSQGFLKVSRREARAVERSIAPLISSYPLSSHLPGSIQAQNGSHHQYCFRRGADWKCWTGQLWRSQGWRDWSNKDFGQGVC